MRGRGPTEAAANAYRFTAREPYDAVGNLLNDTDDNGKVTKRVYDTLNRMTQLTSPLSKVTKFTYDAEGNSARRIEANGRYTNYT